MPARAGTLFPANPFSSKSAGTTSAAFLKLPNGARYEALGGAGAALVDTADALWWNPAGLARLEAQAPSDVTLSYGALLESTYEGAVAYARPSLGHGVFGAGVAYFSQSAQTSYSVVGDPTGSFAPYDMALAAAYGMTINGLRAGVALKLIRSSLAEVSGATAAIDAGVQAEHAADVGSGALDVGAVVSNLGPPLKLGSVAAPLPFSLRGGVVWHASPGFNFVADLVLPVDQDPYAAVAGEALLKEAQWSAALRLGFNQSRTRGIDGFTGLTAGGGLDLDRLRLDYAWVGFGDLGWAHRVTLAFRF